MVLTDRIQKLGGNSKGKKPQKPGKDVKEVGMEAWRLVLERGR